MSYTLSYSSIARHQAPLKSEFGGSSKYAVIDGNIFPKAKTRTEPNTAKNVERLKSETDDCDCVLDGKNFNDFTKEIDDRPLNKYKLNKSKVRKRCHALSRLEKSKKFLAFYTITFPEGLSDSDCYKFFNL